MDFLKKKLKTSLNPGLVFCFVTKKFFIQTNKTKQIKSMKIKATGEVGCIYSTATGFTKAKRKDGCGWKQVDESHRTFVLFPARYGNIEPVSHRYDGYALF